MENEEWCLEEIWLSLMLMEQNRCKLDFADEGDLYDMVAKCLKIINKALNVRGAKKNG